MSIQSMPPAACDFTGRTGPLSEHERLALTALSLAHPKPVSMRRVLREPEPVTNAAFLGMAELRLRGWVRVRGNCWSMTARGLIEAPSSPGVAVLRRVMSGCAPVTVDAAPATKPDGSLQNCPDDLEGSACD